MLIRAKCEVPAFAVEKMRGEFYYFNGKPVGRIVGLDNGEVIIKVFDKNFEKWFRGQLDGAGNLPVLSCKLTGDTDD